MTSQMVSRFRVKKLSPKHPLPVYKESQLPDLTDPANLQRSVPQIETGVEKEEEEEHDLQAAISAAQAAVTTGAQVERYIPTPDASRMIDTKEYNSLYPKRFKEPYTLIRFSSTVEDCIGCPYNMDEEDDSFLKQLKKTLKPKSISEDHFEQVMWELESITNQQLPHLSLDPSQIPDFDAFQSLIPPQSTLLSEPGIDDIFEHWRARRTKRAGKPIIPVLQYEDLVKNEVDPYVCFRRRETKSVRKTRRTDQQSMERLRRLRSEMEMARNLLEMVLRREKLRKEGLVLEHSVFDKKCKFREYQRTLGIKEDEDMFATTPKKRRKISSGEMGSRTTIKIPVHRLKRNGLDSRPEKSPMQLAIETKLLKKKEQDAAYEDLTECPYQPFPKSIPNLFYNALSPSHSGAHEQPLYRKRQGRNGRLYLDRAGHHHTKLPLVGGNSDLSEAQSRAHQRYRFDTDNSTEDDEDDEDSDGDDDSNTYMNVMNEWSMRYRSQLLSQSDLHNLTTIPFLTPLNSLNSQDASDHASTMDTTFRQSSLQAQPSPVSTSFPQVVPTGSPSASSALSSSLSSAVTSNTAAAIATEIPAEPTLGAPSPNLSSTNASTARNQTHHNGESTSPGTITSVAIKRQNSRNKMTPQQAAVAMANGMLVANMAAAVNHNGQTKTPMQMAMEAAQQNRKLQQQQQQQQPMVSSSNMGPSAVGTFTQP